jgi:hypothetical protein
MRSKEAKAKFVEADRLYKAKQYEAALTVLDELDAQFPETRNIIYPRAMCLARLGKFDKALDLCQQLKVEFGDPRGESLTKKIADLRKALAESEKPKEKEKVSSVAPTFQIYTLDSSPPDLGSAENKKHSEFTPVFDPTTQSASGGLLSQDINQSLDAFDMSGAPVMDAAGLDDIFAMKTAPPPMPKYEPGPMRWVYIGIGVAAALVVAALLAFPLVRNGGSLTSAPPATRTTVQASEPAPPPEIKWFESFEAGMETAYEEGRPVLLYFYSSNNPSNDQTDMDEGTWNDTNVRQLLSGFVCIRVDIDKDTYDKEFYEVSATPTTILSAYAWDNPALERSGYIPASDFLKQVAELGLEPYRPPDIQPLPVAALVLLPIFGLVAAFVPLFLTLLILGKLPEDDPVSGAFGILAVGCAAPFLGFILLRSVYDMGRFQYFIYYAILSAHLLVFYLILSTMVGMPFHDYVYYATLER